MDSYEDIIRSDPRAAAGLLVPLGGVATDPDGVNYAVADIDGDDVTLRVQHGSDAPARTVHARKGEPVRIDEREVVVSAVLTEEGRRPWIVIGPA